MSVVEPARITGDEQASPRSLKNSSTLNQIGISRGGIATFVGPALSQAALRTGVRKRPHCWKESWERSGSSEGRTGAKKNGRRQYGAATSLPVLSPARFVEGRERGGRGESSSRRKDEGRVAFAICVCVFLWIRVARDTGTDAS